MQLLRLAAVVLIAVLIANVFGSTAVGISTLSAAGVVGALVLRRRVSARLG